VGLARRSTQYLSTPSTGLLPITLYAQFHDEAAYDPTINLSSSEEVFDILESREKDF
jgi:hypothetical protein